MTAAPRFSIVVCNHDYERFVGAAIESCLAQDYPRELFELIVVDDGSTDRSREVIARYAGEPGVTVVHQENRGQGAAFVAGIERARFEHVCFLDSDDTFLPGKLAAIAARIGEIAPVPEHFFLCHDLTLIDLASGRALDRTWLSMMGADRFGPMLDIANVERDFPFSIPCGQVMSTPLARMVAETLVAWEWPRGADSVFAQSAFLICGEVHYLSECLGHYRIHGDNFFATMRNGQFAPRPHWVSRWPKLARHLERLLDTLPLDARDRAVRLAHLKRLERIARHTSSAHRFAEPAIGFVLAGGDARHLQATVEACLAQSHGKVRVAVTGELRAGVDALPASLARELIVARPGDHPLAELGHGYDAVGGDYVCFLASGDLPDPIFGERHLHMHRYGAVTHLTASDFRVIDRGDVMLSSNVMHGAGRWRVQFENAAPFSSAIGEWPFAPLCNHVFRRSRLVEVLFRAPLPEGAQGLAWMPGWLLLQGIHHLLGSIRINECLMSMRIADAASLSYARLLEPLDADGEPAEPEPESGASALCACFGRNELELSRLLPAGWWIAFAQWIRAGVAPQALPSVIADTESAGGRGLAALLAGRAG